MKGFTDFNSLGSTVEIERKPQQKKGPCGPCQPYRIDARNGAFVVVRLTHVAGRTFTTEFVAAFASEEDAEKAVREMVDQAQQEWQVSERKRKLRDAGMKPA